MFDYRIAPGCSPHRDAAVAQGFERLSGRGHRLAGLGRAATQLRHGHGKGDCGAYQAWCPVAWMG